MKRYLRGWTTANILVLVAIVAIATAGVTALLVNIVERKNEAGKTFVRLVEVTEDTTDPAEWGINFPQQYDAYLRTAEATRTRFGGHGGSEALPEQKIERDPWLQRMFRGYAFSIDYRDRRGHAYMLTDQEETERQTKPYQYSYKDLNAKLHDMGHANPVSCVDCHDPDTMALRVTRPGFIYGIQALAEGDAEVPHLPTVQKWREGSRAQPYDPNVDATRTEMRSFVCAQCHVEYYCANKMPLTFPWGDGLTADNVEKFWNETTFDDGQRFFDYTHAETGAEVLKAQHPEYELWSQGIHARSGVSCADCHMPYQREGASKVSDHWVRSPLLNVNRACQTCHRIDEGEILSRVDAIQQRNFDLLQRGGAALMDLLDAVQAAKEAGATDEQLKPALELQRKAQWRLDFIAAENSMGFHAPQEAARVLGEAADYARQGQVAAMRWREDRVD
jgi:nitrite reductase (cytochrome c-552)